MLFHTFSVRNIQGWEMCAQTHTAKFGRPCSTDWDVSWGWSLTVFIWVHHETIDDFAAAQKNHWWSCFPKTINKRRKIERKRWRYIGLTLILFIGVTRRKRALSGCWIENTGNHYFPLCTQTLSYQSRNKSKDLVVTPVQFFTGSCFDIFWVKIMLWHFVSGWK